MDKNSRYRKIFRDIVRGYSILKENETLFFAKHLTVQDQVDLDEVYSHHYTIAQARGLPTEAEASLFLKKEGLWTGEEERESFQKEIYIENLIATKKSLVLKSQLDRQNKHIEEEGKLLEKINSKKRTLMGVTCESYSDLKVNDHYIINSLYCDAQFSSKIFNLDEFKRLGDDELEGVIKEYNKIFEEFQEIRIQEMILKDFYYVYFPFCDDSVGFFGKPICELSHNQLKMIIYTRVFKNIFEQHENIPESIKSDPAALLDFGNIDEKAREKIQKQNSKDSAASTMFGATKEDMEYAGLDVGIQEAGDSLAAKAAEKGGTLNMEDIMKMHGH